MITTGHLNDVALRMRRIWQIYRIELVLPLISFAAALAIRLPNFMQIPRFSDEGLEVLWALDIARGRQFPLTAVDAYYGPLFSYLTAALLRVFGANIMLPRLMATIFGALTVAATYGLGRAMWDGRAGLVAAGLAATSPDLILGSHMGWSNSLTPFFCTVTVLALYFGVTKRRSGLLALSGLLAAFTLQTHPLMSVALAGMFAWFMLRSDLRNWLARKATLGALALFLFGYAPMIVANLGPSSPTLSQAENRIYAFAPTLAPDEYARRLVVLVGHISSMVGGGIEGATVVLGLPAIIMVSLMMVGLVAAWRRGNGLISAIFLSSVLLSPVFVTTFAGPAERYIAFLIPLGSAAIGVCVTLILEGIGSLKPNLGARFGIARQGAWALVAIGVIAAVFYPLNTISRFYDGAFKSGETNEDFFQLTDKLVAADACGNGLFLEDRRYPGKSHLEAYYTANSIQYVLDLSNCRHISLQAKEISARLLERASQGWLIMPAPSLATFSNTFDLEPVIAISAYQNSTPGPFMLYRVTPHS